jgi:hypothetical protein
LAQQASFDFNPDMLLVQKPPPPLQLPFDGSWPDVRPLRLLLSEGSAAPQWDATARVLTVEVPAGQSRSVNLASVPADDYGFALFDWWQDLLTNPARVRRRESDQSAARRARIRSLTPWRRLTLVNAVQRPLIRPDFSANPISVKRNSGETVCRFVGVTPVDVPSTLKLELMATWDEPVDNGVDPPSRRSFSTQAYRREVAPNEKDPTFADRPWTWNLGDDHPGGNYLLPFHEFHDTRYRRVTYQTVATTRYAEYFVPATSGQADQFTLSSIPTSLDVPASARPAAPKVLYVVPTFTWNEQVDSQGSRTRTRRTGLRVVMDRPWYSSGDGEKLGVMLLAEDPAPPPAPPPPDPPPDPGPSPGPGPKPFLDTALGPLPTGADALVTQWGTDPVIGGPNLANSLMPQPTQFTNAAAVIYGIKPAEQSPAAPYAVVIFEVQFVAPDPLNPGASADAALHPHDGHWIADIDVEPGAANFPFMRLAMVRVQRHAVVDEKGDQRVSPVVLADFVQLAPGRSLSVVADPSDATKLNVTLNGDSYSTQAGLTRCALNIQADCGSPGTPLWLDFGETALTPSNPSTLSLPFARGTRAMRLIVREFERHSADDLVRTDIAQSRTVERLVYADVIAVDTRAT